MPDVRRMPSPPGAPRIRRRGLAVVLTGTDLYRDIQTDAAARRSLDLAQELVVLQECAPEALPAEVRGKSRVIFQSTATRQTLAKSPNRLRAVMVGHLREEKSPETLFAAARLLAQQSDIHIDHIGAALDPALGAGGARDHGRRAQLPLAGRSAA